MNLTTALAHAPTVPRSQFFRCCARVLCSGTQKQKYMFSRRDGDGDSGAVNVPKLGCRRRSQFGMF